MNRGNLPMKHLVPSIVMVLATAAGCGGDGQNSAADASADDSGEVTVTEDGEDTWTPPTAWSDEVTRLIVAGVQGTLEKSGDLSTGALIDPSWGHDPDVYCWVGPQGIVDFGGAHVFYAIEPLVPVNSVLEIELVPDEGLDLNLYALAYPVGTYFVPPHVPSAIDCLNGDDEPAGGVEVVEIHTITEPYNLLIGVTGPEGTVEGSFTLRLTQHEN